MVDMAFESWLEKKAQEILTKAEKAPIKEDDMLVLCVRDVNQQIERVEGNLNNRFEQIDKRFENVDKKFDRVYDTMKWQTGLMVVMFAGIYVKLFIG